MKLTYLALFYVKGCPQASTLTYLPPDGQIRVAVPPEFDRRSLMESFSESFEPLKVETLRTVAWFIAMRTLPEEVVIGLPNYPDPYHYSAWNGFLPDQWVDRQGHLRNRDGQVVFEFAPTSK
jgi:hypothetical protein